MGGGIIPLLFEPQFSEQLYCSGSVPGVVIIHKAKKFPNLFAADHLLEDIHPIVQIAGTVHDHFVPGLRLRLDAFPVTKPANVSEIGSDQIKLFLHLPRPGHPGLVNERHRHTVFPQQFCVSSIHPAFVSNLDRKLIALRKFLEEWFQPRKEFRLALERRFIEIAELEQKRPELIPEQVYRFQKVFQIVFGVQKNFFVGYDLWDFCGEDEPRRGFQVPAFDRRDRRGPVESVIQFNRVEFRGVIAEEVAGLHPFGIERPDPSFRCEGACS